MTESSAEKIAQNPDHDALDDTLQLPALERMLAASEEMLDKQRRSPADDNTDETPQMVLLRRLVELSESIDGRLEQMANLLTVKSPPRRRISARKKNKKR